MARPDWEQDSTKDIEWNTSDELLYEGDVTKYVIPRPHCKSPHGK